ncbi:MAG: hypothetical protein ACI86S_000103 [Paracoccaceae bacterium]|jgi:hypothetical protein
MLRSGTTWTGSSLGVELGADGTRHPTYIRQDARQFPDRRVDIRADAQRKDHPHCVQFIRHLSVMLSAGV